MRSNAIERRYWRRHQPLRENDGALLERREVSRLFTDGTRIPYSSRFLFRVWLISMRRGARSFRFGKRIQTNQARACEDGC